MKRYTITLGASTTSGGKVVSASCQGSINGMRIALEDDLISCSACKSQGKIQCIGPRIPETWNGKKVALENDLCICKCPKPPKLVPNQTLRCQNLAGEGGSSSAHTQSDIVDKTIPGDLFDDKFILLDADMDAPMRFTEYAVKRGNGSIEFGTTDDLGHTHLLTATAASESIDIYL